MVEAADPLESEAERRIRREVRAAATSVGSSRPILRREQAVLEDAPDGVALAGLIDHTLLSPQATREDIARACSEGLQHGFASVVVPPIFVQEATDHLRGSAVLPASVVGFPLGSEFPQIKAEQADILIAAGVRELDMVLAIGPLLSGAYGQVAADILSVLEVCHPAGVLVKVILETGALDRQAKIAGTLLTKEVGADYVKTSTGFGPGQATVEDVGLMRSLVGEEIGVKASGGIRTLKKMKAMIEAGASRIGATQGPAIMAELAGS